MTTKPGRPIVVGVDGFLSSYPAVESYPAVSSVVIDR
jgi:hypothetical protein